MNGVAEKASRYLLAAQNPDGGWGYSANSGQSAPEPSCYSLLALNGHGRGKNQKGLAWLESQVDRDGAVRLTGDDEAHWTTSLAALTLVRLDPEFERLPACLNRLLSMKGSQDAAVGWAWNEHTYSWVEPTCYAVLALKAAGRGTHPRVTDAEHMLELRACVGGGWNQGLRVSFLREMAPLLPQTALAMLALQDRPKLQALLDEAAAFLLSGVKKEPSALGLALAILAFHATGHEGTGLPEKLEERQGSDGSWRETVHLTALGVLALKAVKEGWNAFKL